MIKRFIYKSLIIALLTFITTQIKPQYLLYHDRYKNTIEGNEVYYSIFKSKQKKRTRKIILGDSVGNQLFSNITNNDTVNSLACNQAISLVGHFILLNNYINSGNEIDTVFMIFRPFSFRNNLDKIYTYHYFLKPFYNDEYMKLFTENVHKQVEKIPFRKFCRYPNILTSTWSPEFVPKDKINYTLLSPISVEYLNKITELSVKHNFKVILIPPPLRSGVKSAVDRMDKNEIKNTGMGKEFEYYFKNLTYLNDTCFSDTLHLKDPHKYSIIYKNKFLGVL
jgi:hypothetical protein